MAIAEFKEPLWRIVRVIDVSRVQVSTFEFYEPALRHFRVLYDRGAQVELRDPSGRSLLSSHYPVQFDPQDDGLIDSEDGSYVFDGDGPGCSNTGRFLPDKAGGSGAA